MSEEPKPEPKEPKEPREQGPTYEGSRFPWWMVMYWVAFFVFCAVYLTLYMFPDLKLWLTDSASQIWK